MNCPDCKNLMVLAKPGHMCLDCGALVPKKKAAKRSSETANLRKKAAKPTSKTSKSIDISRFKKV